jgi:drug/metabolite transporter (DMT)-like permease
MFCWYYGLAFTPLATATALGMLEPVFAALFAIFFLGEKSERARWIAAGLGFAGMLIIVRPGFESVSLASLILVVAAMFWGVSVTTGKVLTRTESVTVVVAYPALFAIPFSLFPAAAVWVWPTPEQYFWLFVMGLVSVLGSVCIARAYKVGDVTAVSPFSFMRMVFAAIIGFAVFAEVPVIWTWIGGACIAAAGTYIAHREAQAGRAKKAAAAAKSAAAP